LLNLKGLSKAEAMRRLNMFKNLIWSTGGQEVEELSKGMQQKVQFITIFSMSQNLLFR